MSYEVSVRITNPKIFYGKSYDEDGKRIPKNKRFWWFWFYKFKIAGGFRIRMFGVDTTVRRKDREERWIAHGKAWQAKRISDGRFRNENV